MVGGGGVPVVRARLGKTIANDPVPGEAGEPHPSVSWLDVPWAEVERRFSSCVIRPLNASNPSELVVSSLDVHRVLGLRVPHRAWMLRKLARFRLRLGSDVFDAKASAALVVVDGVVVSFAPGGAGLFLSLNSAVFMSGAGDGLHGKLFYRWIEWFETAHSRAWQAQRDRFDANQDRILAALAVRTYAGEPPGNA